MFSEWLNSQVGKKKIETGVVTHELLLLRMHADDNERTTSSRLRQVQQVVTKTHRVTA